MVRYIPFTGDRARVLKKIKEEASKRGISFVGTIDSGRFAGRGIVGRYWFLYPQKMTIQIDQMPPFITEDKIVKGIQKYLESFY